MSEAVALPSFPNSIWERLLVLAKFHFALTGRGNGVARTSAFPSATWERGKAGNAKGVAILKRRVGASAPTLEKPQGGAINLEKVESISGAVPVATTSFEAKDSTFSRLDSAEGETRVGAARQPFALFLQRLWRCGRGNGVARTIGFPNDCGGQAGKRWESASRIPGGFQNRSRWLSPQRAITTGMESKSGNTSKGFKSFFAGENGWWAVLQPLRGRSTFLKQNRWCRSADLNHRLRLWNPFGMLKALAQRLVSSKGKTRVGAARQLFALFLQRRWRCGRGNGVARTSAFPNGVWERGIRTLLLVIALTFGIGISANAEQPFSNDDSRVSSADLSYFCDSISFDKGEWRFELSKNSAGLSWRLSSLKRDKDVTGICSEKQELVVPDGDALLLKGEGYFVAFVPKDPGTFKVTAHLEPGYRDSLKNRTRNATLLKGKPGGAYVLLPETH